MGRSQVDKFYPCPFSTWLYFEYLISEYVFSWILLSKWRSHHYDWTHTRLNAGQEKVAIALPWSRNGELMKLNWVLKEGQNEFACWSSGRRAFCFRIDHIRRKIMGSLLFCQSFTYFRDSICLAKEDIRRLDCVSYGITQLWTLRQYRRQHFYLGSLLGSFLGAYLALIYKRLVLVRVLQLRHSNKKET